MAGPVEWFVPIVPRAGVSANAKSPDPQSEQSKLALTLDNQRLSKGSQRSPVHRARKDTLCGYLKLNHSPKQQYTSGRRDLSAICQPLGRRIPILAGYGKSG